MKNAGNGTGIRKDALKSSMKRSRLKKSREDDDRNNSRWVLDGKGGRVNKAMGPILPRSRKQEIVRRTCLLQAYLRPDLASFEDFLL